MLSDNQYWRFLFRVERRFELELWTISRELDKAQAWRTNDINAINKACPMFAKNDIHELQRKRLRYMERGQAVAKRIYA